MDMDNMPEEFEGIRVPPESAGIPRNRIGEFNKEYLRKFIDVFPDNPAIPMWDAFRTYSLAKGGHRKIIPSEAYPEEKLLEIIEFIRSYNNSDYLVLWRAGNYWMVSPKSRDIDAFLKADEEHRVNRK